MACLQRGHDRTTSCGHQAIRFSRCFSKSRAIVGNVNAPAEGMGARKKPEVQPHALAYAPGIEMPREVEKEREKVPVAGGAGILASAECTGPAAALLKETGTP